MNLTRIFKFNNGDLKNANSKKINDSKHKKLLNNLLDIRTNGDNATFYHLSKINQDLNKIIKKDDVKKVFVKSEFEVELTSAYTDDQINRLNNLKTYEEFVIWAQEAKYKVPVKLEKDLARNFSKHIGEISEKLTNKHVNFLKEWRFNINKIQEIYTETGIWPLFVGTFFIRYAKDDLSLYAPLLLKAVNLEIKNGKVILTNRDNSIVYNEKLVYVLKQSSGIVMPILDNPENISLEEAALELKSVLGEKIVNGLNDLTNEMIDKFKEMQRDDLGSYTTITLSPGIVLSICHPQGTKLREALYNLIIEDKIEKLIKNDDLTNHEKNAKQALIDEAKLIRVARTDLSQEKAIIGALTNSAVIIGPPGTGKSQTIANILVNILENGKRALFISQKKAALDVVLKRMGRYSDLVFQFNETNKANKYERNYFYRPLNNFYREMLDLNVNEKIPENKETFLKKAEFDYINAKKDLSFVNSGELKSYYNIMNAKDESFESDYKEVKKLFSHLNAFENKVELEAYLDYYDVFKKAANSKNYKEVKKAQAKAFKDYIATLNVANQKGLEKLSSKLEIQSKKSHAKQIRSLFKKADKLGKYSVVDFIKIGSLLRFNTLRIFDEVESKYKNYIDNKTNSNTTPEQLENMYKKVALEARKRLEEFKVKKEDGENELKVFLGKISRGITAPHVLINQHKDMIHNIYNVFVGTPEILSNFVDFSAFKTVLDKKGNIKEDQRPFDYVIFDESSQIFIEKALPFIALSKHVIVAGDDQQMQPSNWFSRRDDSEDDYSQDEVNSLLDWALHNNLPKFFLEMNYRSNSSELILFSAKEFYDSKLKGIDKYNSLIDVPLEVYNVNGSWRNNRNIVEAQQTVKLAEENIDKYESMILLAFNRKQQDAIREVIAETSPKLYSLLEDKIYLRNLENIQGDEADIVIASIGYTKEAALSSTYIGTKGGRNALNVAITRAKDKMIVIKSITAEEVMPSSGGSGNLTTFKKWLEFLDLTKQEQKAYTTIEKDSLSRIKTYFEQDVMQWLKSLEFTQPIKIKTNYRIGSYAINIAILDENEKFLVGISLDDSTDSKTIDDLLEIRLKDDFIASKGYPIYRISNFRFEGEKNSILKYLSMIINR
ncbi:DEAD/DEAH box helicase [Mycoplasma sp. Ms02]|uniref:DEAD/DEAH box helicase n=1 Tax=Mycoplasma sp. Ms02 TaxID=353851 RepID=UPI001C8AA21D|nr:DEAD/DEAH box helicase [Mycoplasma sp. Ms02]QZE12540.1 DNA2/NAM7 family helicase [Mycoplasma sp. Ms02]